MNDEDRISLTEAARRAFRKVFGNKHAVIQMMQRALTAAEIADWQELENHSVLTSYEIDRLLSYMEKAGIVKITAGGVAG